jgi:O-antigen/teichoic acid export membrane protein
MPTATNLPTRRFANTTSVISLHKAAQIAGAAVTVMVVPRLLGPEMYGRFSFVLSLTFLAAILADFGTLDVFGRFVPAMEPDDARKLYMRTLAFTLTVSAACFALTVALALALADWMRPEWALLAGMMVVLRVVSWVPFQFALAKNRIGVWMTEQAWRQWVLLAVLLLLYPLLGFTGALLALVAMEALFAGLGLWWGRPYWLRSEFGWEWSYYRFYVVAGFGFFVANLAAVALYRSGPVLVETLTGNSAEAGYLNLAIGLYLIVYGTVSQFAQSLIPTLTRLRTEGRADEMRRRVSRFVRVGLVITIAGAAAVWLLAGWGAPIVFGRGFGPAAEPMQWLSLAMPLSVIVWAANVTATVTGRGAAKASGILAALGAFLVGAFTLVPNYGATGAALALAVAVLVQAVVLSVRLRLGLSGA